MLLVHGTNYEPKQHVHSRCHTFEETPGEYNTPLHTNWNNLHILLVRSLLENVMGWNLRPTPRGIVLVLRVPSGCPSWSWGDLVDEVAATVLVLCWGSYPQTWSCIPCKDASSFCILAVWTDFHKKRNRRTKTWKYEPGKEWTGSEEKVLKTQANKQKNDWTTKKANSHKNNIVQIYISWNNFFFLPSLRFKQVFCRFSWRFFGLLGYYGMMSC